MKKSIGLVFGLSMLATCTLQAESYKQFSIFAGIGYHNESTDCPEVCFQDNKLFMAQIKYKPNEYTAIIGTHISAIEIQEKGYGFNGGFIGIDYGFDLY